MIGDGFLARLIGVIPAPYLPAPGAPCPACGTRSGAVALLTATQIYFACSACEHRWGLTRVAEAADLHVHGAPLPQRQPPADDPIHEPQPHDRERQPGN